MFCLVCFHCPLCIVLSKVLRTAPPRFIVYCAWLLTAKCPRNTSKDTLGTIPEHTAGKPAWFMWRAVLACRDPQDQPILSHRRCCFCKQGKQRNVLLCLHRQQRTAAFIKHGLCLYKQHTVVIN